MKIRTASEADAGRLSAIYGHHVLHGFGTFEEIAPTPEEMDARRAGVAARALPYLVAEQDGLVLGFAYAAPFRARAAYRYTVEDSVYIAPGHLGRGLGKALLSEVVARCKALGLRQMVAVIGDQANAGSIGLHRAMGFRPVGVFEAVGFKADRWVDVVVMQRPLNEGDGSPPTTPGLTLSGG